MHCRIVQRFLAAAQACALGLVLAVGGGVAVAAPADENVTWAYAQVLRASPVYETQRVRLPEERCEGGTGAVGAVAGAVVGGALGNQVGKGDGNKAATVAGAVLGGVIGRRVDRNGAHCRTVLVEREQRRLVGYDVEYRYQGKTYMSHMAADPGNRVRVRVSVQPDDPTAP